MSRKIRKRAWGTPQRRLFPLSELARRGGYASASLLSFWSLSASLLPLLSSKTPRSVSDLNPSCVTHSLTRFRRINVLGSRRHRSHTYTLRVHLLTHPPFRVVQYPPFSIMVTDKLRGFASDFLSRYLSPSLFVFFCGFRVCLSQDMHILASFPLWRVDAKPQDDRIYPRCRVHQRMERNYAVLFRGRRELLHAMVTRYGT